MVIQRFPGQTADTEYEIAERLPSWKVLVAAAGVLVLIGALVGYGRSVIPGIMNSNKNRDLGYLSIAAQKGYIVAPPPKAYVEPPRPLVYTAPMPPPVQAPLNVVRPATSVSAPSGSVVSGVASFRQASMSFHCAKCGATSAGTQFGYPSQTGCPSGGPHLWIPDGHPAGG